MLQVKQVKKYDVPRYPTGEYFENENSGNGLFFRGAAASVALLAALQGSQCIGTTGPPPVMPDMVTENEARAIVDSVFSTYDYRLLFDVNLPVPGSTQTVSLDGYDSTTRTGYEYMSGNDFGEFSDSTKDAFQSSREERILFLNEETKDGDYRRRLEQEVNDFISIIRAGGTV